MPTIRSSLVVSMMVPVEQLLQSVDAVPAPRIRIGVAALLAGSRQRMRSARLAGVNVLVGALRRTKRPVSRNLGEAIHVSSIVSSLPKTHRPHRCDNVDSRW